MSIQLKKVSSKKDIDTFLKFPIELYKNNPNYVPQLLMEDKKLFDEKHEPFYQKGTVVSYLAYKEDKIVGRISCITNDKHNKIHNEKTGFFGFFDVINDKEVASVLLDKAKEYAKENKMDTLRGPMNFSLSHTAGSLIKGFDLIPSLLTPYNSNYYNDLLSSYGFEKAMDLYSYLFTKEQGIPEKLARVANAMQERGKFRIEFIQKKDLKRVVKEIQVIFNDAWKENWSFLPLSDDDIAGLASELSPILVPEISYMVYDGDEAVACMVTLPNINEALQHGNGTIFSKAFLRLLGIVLGFKKTKAVRTVIMGVKESHRRKGVEAIMIHRTIVEGQKLGFEQADLSWVLENNTMMTRQLEKMGADRYKEHRIYDLKV